jgi:hypothetical protein
MTTRLKLYNAALQLCGHSRISALTDETEGRRELDFAWDNNFIRKVLEKGQWNFAIRSQQLTPETSVTPPFGYQNAYLKGDDWITTTAVCDDEFYRTPLLLYEDEQSYIFTDRDMIWVKFVSDDSSFGGDLSKWTGCFEEYAEAFLASKVIQKLTSDKERIQFLLGPRADGKQGYMAEKLREAKSNDAMDQPTAFLPTGSWVSSRGEGKYKGPFGDRGITGKLIGS